MARIKGIYSEQASLTAGALNADLVPATDVSAYKWLSLQVLGTWSGTITFQGSNDNTNWSSVPVTDINLGSVLLTTTTNRFVVGAIGYRYVRVRMTSYASGTATGTLELYTVPPPGFASWATQAGIWTVQPGNTQNTTPWLTSETPKTSGGLTPFKRISTADTNAAVIKASAGQVYGVVASNVNAAVRYLKLYDKATAPTVGTDVPVLTIALTGGAVGNVVVADFPGGVAFAAGIAMALTTEATDAGSTGVAANEIVVNALYK